MARAGRSLRTATNRRAPGPFNFRGCDLTARMAPRQGACPGATPGNRTNFHRPRVSLRDRVSKTQFARGSTEAACHFHGVVADKQCTCLASRLMRARYPPTPPFHCGENEIQASLISSAYVGATPTPATNLREVIQPAVCKPAVIKQRWKMTTGAFELPVPPQVSFPKHRCSLSRTVVQHFPPSFALSRRTSSDQSEGCPP